VGCPSYTRGRAVLWSAAGPSCLKSGGRARDGSCFAPAAASSMLVGIVLIWMEVDVVDGM
jgi:hypothetical protein